MVVDTDTPGLSAAPPGSRPVGPLLRTPEKGADTNLWLATTVAAIDHIQPQGRR